MVNVIVRNKNLSIEQAIRAWHFSAFLFSYGILRDSLSTTTTNNNNSNVVWNENVNIFFSLSILYEILQCDTCDLLAMKIGQKLLMLRETWKSIRLIAQPANCFAAIHFNYIHTIFCLFRLRQYSEVENEANDKMKNKAAKQNDKNMHFIFQINDPMYIWIHAFYWANVGGKGRNKLEFIYGIDLSANGKCIANVSTMCVLYIYLYMGKWNEHQQRHSPLVSPTYTEIGSHDLVEMARCMGKWGREKGMNQAKPSQASKCM